MRLARVAIVALALLFAVTAVSVYRRERHAESLAERRFEFTYIARVPELPRQAKTLRLWIPLPRADEYQSVSDLRFESPLPLSRHHETEYGNEYLYLEAERAAFQTPLEVRLRFSAVRHEHRVELSNGWTRVAAAGNEDPRLLARFLARDRLVPVDGLIAQLADQTIRGRETPLEKARAIYAYVISTMRYDKSGTGWGRGDALYACDVRRGNCTDFHALFIGMMRAAGIPARFEIGFSLPAASASGEIGGYHCWAQFYLEPYGWIPVDASEAWKHPEKRGYFFGAHDADRVLFTLGRDIRLNPTPAGEPLNYFIYPYAEVDGKELKGIESHFIFRNLPAQTP
ncbi:MAG: transglutaminase-like domain-containing protein [Candidatus Acidiferrales bacterium]